MKYIAELTVSCMTICIVVLIVGSQVYYTKQSRIIAEMVEGGASPLEALCAITDAHGNNPVCVLLASREAAR